MKSLGDQKLKLVILFLLVLNLTTFGTIAYHMFQEAKNDQVKVNAMQNSASYNGRYFRDRLDLNPTQMNDFKNVNFSFRQKARLINQALIQHKRSMLNAMQQEEIDTLLLTELSGEIGDLHSDLKIETYQYYLGIRDVCTVNQKAELNLIFNEFFINDKQALTPGGGKQKKRRGNGGR